LIVAGWRGEAGGLPRFDRTGRDPLRNGCQSGGRTSAFTVPGQGRNYTPAPGYAFLGPFSRGSGCLARPINQGRDHERARRNRQEETPAEAKGGAHKTSRAEASATTGNRGEGRRTTQADKKGGGGGGPRTAQADKDTQPRAPPPRGSWSRIIQNQPFCKEAPGPPVIALAIIQNGDFVRRRSLVRLCRSAADNPGLWVSALRYVDEGPRTSAVDAHGIAHRLNPS